MRSPLAARRGRSGGRQPPVCAAARYGEGCLELFGRPRPPPSSSPSPAAGGVGALRGARGQHGPARALERPAPIERDHREWRLIVGIDAQELGQARVAEGGSQMAAQPERGRHQAGVAEQVAAVEQDAAVGALAVAPTAAPRTPR